MKHTLSCLLVGLIALAGCAPTATKNKGTETPKTTDNAKGGEKIKLAFVTNNSSEFWTIAKKGTMKAQDDFNVDVDFRLPSSGGSEEQQRIVKELQNRGVQGIAISPNDAANLVDFCAQVNKSLPLITQDSDLPDPSARRCYIGTHTIGPDEGRGSWS